MIALESICKSYYVGPVEIPVLKDISLNIATGDQVAIVGPSGCGKSTLMYLLGLLDTPTSGRYLFDERDVSGLSDATASELRNRRIGFVFQQFQLLPRLTALENVALPLMYRGLSDKKGRFMAWEALDRVGLAERMTHRPNMLSGGQQQRVAIARALVGKPELILADEPTGALDSRVGADIMQLFLELNRVEGITLVIITHDRRVARQCARQCRMEDGKLVES